jgi:hypothetical protein
MKKLIGFAVLLTLFSAGCPSNPGSSSKKSECRSPENPYDEGSGHYAGFQWAQENGQSCNGNSESFNEGCREYFRQQNTYESCLKNKEKTDD